MWGHGAYVAPDWSADWLHREAVALREKALAVLAERDFAVIVSDQRMPQMSGTEFLSLTATQYPDIIRIILTGYTDVEDLVEAINSGKVFKYVTKPWEAEELRGVVQQALDTHNVLKARTRELCRTLRQESLLNTVTNTIRSRTDYREILQTIANTVGHMLEADACIIRPFQDEQMVNQWFVYQKPQGKSKQNEPEQTSSAVLALISISKTSMSAKRLKSTPLPSMTGFAAYGPMSPRPSTAVPFEMTATRLPREV